MGKKDAQHCCMSLGLLGILISIILIITGGIAMSDCDQYGTTGNCPSYQKKNITIIDYLVDSTPCTHCFNETKTCHEHCGWYGHGTYTCYDECDTHCYDKTNMICYESYAVGAYSLTNINDTCNIKVDTNNMNVTNALIDAIFEFPVNNTFSVYNEVGTVRCIGFLPKIVNWAVTTLVVGCVSIIGLLACIIYYCRNNIDNARKIAQYKVMEQGKPYYAF